MQNAFEQSSRGAFWVTLDAYMSILKVKDLIGLKRATGGAFFAAAEYSTFALQEFIGLTNTANQIFSMVESTLPEVHSIFINMTLENKDMIDLMLALEDEIFTRDPLMHQADSDKSLLWFETVTQYMKLYSQIEHHVQGMLEEALAYLGKEIKRNYDISLWIVVAVSVICPPLLILYFVNYQSLMTKMKRFTSYIKDRQTDLKKEKQKTEVLLHQLLPKSLAKDIQAGKTIEPEHFESVTVYFSDVHGFSILSSGSTPFQTVELLNKLYSSIDAILEVYDVYKVETISSQYLVASGLPTRSDHHSEQICSMSLDVMRMMSYFNLPHKPWENLLLKIGCHTANRIQISSACRRHLNGSFPGEFTTVYRHKMTIKGKGEMESYWVLGRKGNPFAISLEKTEAIMGYTDYWKDGEDRGEQQDQESPIKTVHSTFTGDSCLE